MAAVPATASTIEDSLDPQEILDCRIQCDSILEVGEVVDPLNWSISLYAEAVAGGLTIMSGGGRDMILTDDLTQIIFWVQIDPMLADDPMFDDGVELPFLLTLQTDSLPYRKRQRSMILSAVNK